MRLPSGVRDWLPHELRRKREVEASLRGVFERWGYAEVQTPGFERFDVLESALGSGVAEKTFLFSDRRGTQLVLRPEMTTPIARLVSTRMRDAELPLRLCYVQPAYRYEEPQEGRMREFTQAGVELIGAENGDADAESLFTAFEALDAVGLSEARCDVNHVAIVDGVLDSLELPHELLPRLKPLIAERNVVALREMLADPIDARARETLLRLVLLRGQEEALDFARSVCRSPEGLIGIERLAALLDRARQRGVRDRIAVDLSLLRDLNYYTGFVFEGFLSEIGFGIIGGGRYDQLLPRFGFNAGAVGWSLSVERLLIALDRRRAASLETAAIG